MTTSRFVLTDLDRDLHRADARIGPDDVPGAPAGWSVVARRLTGGKRDGVEIVELTCGPLRATLLPTRGMGIWKAWWNDLEFGWQAPIHGPIHPRHVPLAEPSGFGWLDGFDELLVRCGLESNGAPEWDERGRLRWPLHGRIANTPAHQVEVLVDTARGEIAVRGVVDETRLFGRKLRLTSTTTVRLGEPRLRIVDEVVNLSGEAGELELLYHVNFGAPLNAPGARVHLPVKELAPRDATATARFAEWDRCGAREAGRPEEVFFAELLAGADGRTRALLAGPGATIGASLVWRLDQLPRFGLWKNPQLPQDGCVTGLEPATNYPNARSFEQSRGRVIALAPGERRTFELDLELHPDPGSVAHARAAIETLQTTAPAVLHSRPIARFAPL
ncbi:MAG: DUF4432 family protein [Planctomycetes bacterium]|nr:DUF4432 family protein [Planctomycetota bacterium]